MKSETAYVSTTNACKLCSPLGASLAYRGFAGCVPFLHGSQGCATYMRRYIISHFREPMDIASSSLGEKQAVFGGGPNLKLGLVNLMRKYPAGLIGVATTCLTETIGDDVPAILTEFRKEFADLPMPPIVSASTPSYSGTHAEGFVAAVKAVVSGLAVDSPLRPRSLGLFTGMMSCEDLRHLKAICRDFGLDATVLPDFSETLDGPVLTDYVAIPEGGTPLDAVRGLPGTRASVELGRTLARRDTAAAYLTERFGVRRVTLGTPIGIRETDALFRVLEEIAGQGTPREHALTRGRLVDALVDGHKYISGKRAVVYGEDDLVIGLTAFLAEIGVKPVLVASGGSGYGLTEEIAAVTRDILPESPAVAQGVDFFDIAEQAESLAPDLFVGHGKGYSLARKLNVPLIRVGFPIHDRFGGQRQLHVGYQGALTLFDRIVNAVMEKTQADSPIGYGYL